MFLQPATLAAHWRNTTEGIHAFLTFDSRASDAGISEAGSQVDFVWGSTEHQIPKWRAVNPDAILAKYIPFTRDPAPGPHQTTVNGSTTGLPWWQKNMPELVLYQCDRVTPAWECFSGEGCSHASVPLDLTNPATLDFQMSAAVLPAKAAGYTAIALDNYGLTNQWKACGVHRGGGWTQLYNATDPAHDARYTADVLDWTRRAAEKIHVEGLLVVPNFSHEDFDEGTLAVANATDGFLAEVRPPVLQPTRPEPVHLAYASRPALCHGPRACGRRASPSGTPCPTPAACARRRR